MYSLKDYPRTVGTTGIVVLWVVGHEFCKTTCTLVTIYLSLRDYLPRSVTRRQTQTQDNWGTDIRVPEVLCFETRGDEG